MPLRNTPDDYTYNPLRQGDLDGLCGVYAVLNALQFLYPRAGEEFLRGVFDGLLKNDITIKHVRKGGEEPEIRDVHAFVAKEAKKKFKIDFLRTPWGAERKPSETPDVTMASKFKTKENGVFVFGFEGRDSHFTVARAVTPTRVLLFDSWEYDYFEREAFKWGAPKSSKSDKVVVNPREFDWMTIG